MYDRITLAEELSKILDNARREYAQWQENDRAEQARNGAERIERGRFVYPEFSANAADAVSRARTKALAAVDARIRRAERALTDPPTTDEANYITAIRDRKDLTREEMEAALSRYSSHSAQRAILNSAIASGLIPEVSATKGERDLHDLKRLRADVEKTYTADFGNMSATMAALTRGGYNTFAKGGDCSDALAAFSNMG